MIIVPEIETVVILTPRTGTKALRNALLARYPDAHMIYRHMEADGVPLGYDRWRRVGVVRHPVDRLWSLYHFLKIMGGTPDGRGKWEHTYVERQRRSVAKPFDRWLTENEIVFTSPYDSAQGGKFYPGFTVRHPLPETRKSQFIYLRPDLGTEVVSYSDVETLHRQLGVEPEYINAAAAGRPTPQLSHDAQAHIERWFAWDLETVAARALAAAA